MVRVVTNKGNYVNVHFWDVVGYNKEALKGKCCIESNYNYFDYKTKSMYEDACYCWIPISELETALKEYDKFSATTTTPTTVHTGPVPLRGL
jgi:hypothetical protein